VDPTRQPDHELLRLSERDAEAFEAFYLRHCDSLVSFLWRRTGNPDVAQDLAAESFAAAYLQASRFDPSKGDGRGWLFGIAKLALLSSYRRRGVEGAARRQLGIFASQYSDHVWEEVEDRLDVELSGLVAGLDGLSKVERDAVIARILDERDYADIALTENPIEVAIRQRVKRGLHRLAKSASRGA
jgi:DNA-directed RNA polymerase specialized sigma24 family protein